MQPVATVQEAGQDIGSGSYNIRRIQKLFKAAASALPTATALAMASDDTAAWAAVQVCASRGCTGFHPCSQNPYNISRMVPKTRMKVYAETSHAETPHLQGNQVHSYCEHPERVGNKVRVCATARCD